MDRCRRPTGVGTISHPRQPAPDPEPGCRHQQPGHTRGGTECDLPDNWGRSGLQPPRTHALDSSRRKQVPGPHVLGMTLEALPTITTRISMHWLTRARMQAETGSGQGARRCVRPDSLNRTPGPAEALGARYAYNFLGMRGGFLGASRLLLFRISSQMGHTCPICEDPAVLSVPCAFVGVFNHNPHHPINA